MLELPLDEQNRKTFIHLTFPNFGCLKTVLVCLIFTLIFTFFSRLLRGMLVFDGKAQKCATNDCEAGIRVSQLRLVHSLLSHAFEG